MSAPKCHAADSVGGMTADALRSHLIDAHWFPAEMVAGFDDRKVDEYHRARHVLSDRRPDHSHATGTQQ